jgi:hypothetical protein
MAFEQAAVLGCNRGIISKFGMARTDLKRYAFAARIQTNWMPRAVGSMMLRPGWAYIDDTNNDEQAVHLPFIFSLTDTAIIELTNQTMRVRVSEAVISRVAVATTIENGNFASLTGWTDEDQPGCTSSLSGGQLSLVGNGFNYAIRSQQVSVATGDKGNEHALRIVVASGYAMLRVGTSDGLDDYVNETTLDPGTHSIAFTPTGTFYIQLYATTVYPSLVASCNIEAAGVMTLPTPWVTADLSLIRSDQSADVLYLAADSTVNVGIGYQQYKIERRSVRSWSIVQYLADDGPFLLENSGPVSMTPSGLNGTITITASQPTFYQTHVGSLINITSTGQNISSSLAGAGQQTHYVEVTGLSNLNPGDPSVSQRVITINISGTWVGTVTLQRSVGNPGAWIDVVSYTSNQTNLSYDDGLDNQIIYYRLAFDTGNYTSGTAVCTIAYASGSILGIARIMGWIDAQHVTANVLSDFGGSTASAGTQASGWIGFTTNPSNGTTIGLNGATWTFVTSGATGNQTNIQGSVLATIGQLVTDLTASSNVDIVAATYSVAQVGAQVNLNILAVTPGTSGNSFALTAIIKSGVTLTGGAGATNGSSTLWALGQWSNYQGWPTAVLLYEGRLGWTGRGFLNLSVSDAYASFDDTVTGDSGPLSIQIGSGPLDSVAWMIPLQALVLGGQAGEHFVLSNTLQEPLTPTDFNLKTYSTQGSAAVAALKKDLECIFLQRSGQRIFTVSFNPIYLVSNIDELTKFAPDVTGYGTPPDALVTVVKIAIQRQPDTRIHCILSNGTVAVLVYDKLEDLQCWVLVETTNGLVEDAVIMPGITEDTVYYCVNRTVNSVTKRSLERWALEAECIGGTVNKNADCHVVFNNGSPSTTITGLPTNLYGQQVVVWADGIDYSPTTAAGVQTLYTVSNSGVVTMAATVTQGVVGLPYSAQYQSTKLAYAARLGTALNQKKTTPRFGMILANTHMLGVRYGTSFAWTDLTDLPGVEEGAVVPANTVWEYDEEMFEFPADWGTDERVCLLAQAPRPCTVLGFTIGVTTSETT